MPENLSKWIEENLLIHNYQRKSLEGFKKVLKSLDLNKPKEIILIGGTNGKGSLSEMVTSMAIQSNISVGTFTSPHLINFNERIKVNGQEITDIELLDALKIFNKLKKSHQLNFYQIISLAALNYFNNLNLDLWVLEIGMGGRLDPMNFLDPDISVITKVALDHQEFLGNTIEEIAAEKAEIARSQKPLIFGSKKIPKSILKKTSSVNSILETPKDKDESKFLKYILDKFSQKNIISEEVLFCLHEITKKSKFKFSEKTIESALESTKIYGRLTHSKNFLVDSAHNEDSIKNLLEYIQSNFKKNKISLFFCCSKNKDPFKLLKPFESIVDKIYLGDNIHDKLMSSDDILSKTRNLDFSFVVMNSIEEIYASVQRSESNVMNLIVGSFYFSGEFFKFLLKINNFPPSLSNLNKLI